MSITTQVQQVLKPEVGGLIGGVASKFCAENGLEYLPIFRDESLFTVYRENCQVQCFLHEDSEDDTVRLALRPGNCKLIEQAVNFEVDHLLQKIEFDPVMAKTYFQAMLQEAWQRELSHLQKDMIS